MDAEIIVGVGLARVWAGGTTRLQRGPAPSGIGQVLRARVARAAVAPLALWSISRMGKPFSAAASDQNAPARRSAPALVIAGLARRARTQRVLGIDRAVGLPVQAARPVAATAARRQVMGLWSVRTVVQPAASTPPPILTLRMAAPSVTPRITRPVTLRAHTSPRAAVVVGVMPMERQWPLRAMSTATRSPARRFAPGAAVGAMARRSSLAPIDASQSSSPALPNAGHPSVAPAASAFDPAQFGRWMNDHLADAVTRPPSGISGPDDRLTPVFAGMVGPG